MGLLVSFVMAVDLIRWVRPELLFSPDPSWRLPRLILGLLTISVSVGAGVAAAGAFFLWSRTEASQRPLNPLPFSRASGAAIAVAALLAGILARLAALEGIPPVIWIDEILPIRPSLALEGRLSDLADAIRMLPTDIASHAVVGVLYLEVYRWVLQLLGTELFSVRFMSALPGILSLLTAFLLGRNLLPRGGGALTIAALAGLRWQLIIARFGWNTLPLAPIGDLATLLLLRARRNRSLASAAAGGVIAGIGAHVYLGAWILAFALGGYLLWPASPALPRWRRAVLALTFAAGFLATAAPLFLLRKNREISYFVRASDQSLAKDIRRTRSWLPPFSIVADALQAPWLVSDPVPRQDLPKSRLGWIIGVPVAVAFLWALRSPREELSGLLFCHAGAALAASLRWGVPGHPNGFRFVYLTTLTAVAAAAGILWVIGLFPVRRRAFAAILAVGLLTISGVLGLRDLMQWGESPSTFDEYRGKSTLLARAALRWEPFGPVRLDFNLGHSPIMVGVIREYELDPDQPSRRELFGSVAAPSPARRRCFRIAAPGTAPTEGERRVETIRDAWGREHGVVFASFP